MIFVYLLVFVPISLVLEYLFHAPAIWVFFAALVAIAPLSMWIERGTEEVAAQSGPAIGGLLNVTLGNVPELIMALFILNNGLSAVVKGQITGSIISNSLLGLGIAILAGSLIRSTLTFNRAHSGQLSTLLLLVLIGLMLPALFDFTERDMARVVNPSSLDEQLSISVSIILIALYLSNLVYTMVTHRDIFRADKTTELQEPKSARWSLRRALIVLVAATLFTAVESEILSNALSETATALAISPFFLGVVALAIAGNIAGYVSAIYFARKGAMDLVISITVGATIQVALFVAPLLVLISYALGKPMDLVFSNPLELIAIASVAFVVTAISKDGETTWFEGALLVGVYLLMALAFLYVTPV